MANKKEMVPKQVVRDIADNIAELRKNERAKSALQAELIRWCLRAFSQTTEQAERSLTHQNTRRRPSQVAAQAKVREDKELALVHLAWLATQLENEGLGDVDLTPDVARIKR